MNTRHKIKVPFDNKKGIFSIQVGTDLLAHPLDSLLYHLLLDKQLELLVFNGNGIFHFSRFLKKL